jgi:putative membrane protein
VLPVLVAHAGPAPSPWAFDLHPDVVVVLGGLVLAYALALRKFCPLSAGAGQPVITPGQRRLLATGLAAMVAVSYWPVHNLSEGPSYTMHMVQHSVYTLAVPPLLILGTPAWLWRWGLGPVMGLARRLTRPMVALAAFSVVTVLSHLPTFANAAVTSEAAHLAQHVVLVLTAGMMWWPLTSPLPELPRIAHPIRQVMYLVGASLVPSVVGSSLIWAQGTPYTAYEAFPTLGGWTPLEDQRTAGFVMSLADGLVLWGLVLVIFVRFALRQRSPAAPVSPLMSPRA